MFNFDIRRIHTRYRINIPSDIYRSVSNGIVVDQPKKLGTKCYFSTYMFKPNRKVLALVLSRPYLREIVLLTIDYLESKFGKDRKNLFRLAYVLSGMYGIDLVNTIITQAMSIYYGSNNIAYEKEMVEKTVATINMGNKVKFNLKNGVCLPFASNIFLEPWVKEYYSNLIQQYDRNVFYIHLIDSMASMEKYSILDTTLSWSHCSESSDVWIDRNRKFNEKYD